MEISEDKVDVIIALLAKLVAASSEEDPVLTLRSTGMKQSDIARVLGMKPNAVGMRVTRAGQKKPNGRSKR